MIFVRNASDLFAPSVGVQTPLTTADMFTVGTVISGVGAANIWEVVEAPADGYVLLKDITKDAPPGSHHHRFNANNGRTCACGMRRQSLETILPQAGAAPHVYCIRPPSGRTVTRLQDFTVYITMDGKPVMPRPADVVAGVIGSLPVFAILHPVWTLPEELRAWTEL